MTEIYLSEENQQDIFQEFQEILTKIKSAAPDERAQTTQAMLSKQVMDAGGDQTMPKGYHGPFEENLKLTKSELQRIIQEELENVTKGN